MSISPLLLVAAPMLQDYLVDNATGLPLSSGVVTLYKDNSRTTFKNWYYQSGSPGAYTYITLPNPMTLSAVGTITDGNGNDVIPFYYPFSENDNQTPETYYITVVNANGQQQFTRQNFPFSPEEPVSVTNPTLENYLVNNVFWQNIGAVNVSTLTNTITLNGSTNYYKTLAPSQHDVFSMPDIIFLKNINGATDNITFSKFALGDPSNQVLTNDITPEYYLNFNCSAAQPGETLKCIQIPISLHIKTLESVEATVVIHAQNISGNNTLTLAINQYLGTGVTTPSIPLPAIQTITVGAAWTKYIFQFTFPSAAGLTVSAANDDALYLQIGLPLNATFQTNIAKPQVYLSQEIPSNNFDTYDSIDSVVNSPRTGDYRLSLNGFQPFGWVALQDGTIGDNASGATTVTNANGANNTWPLYNLLWTNVNNTFAPVSSGRGGSAYADYTANKTIGLTKALGRLLMGLPTSSTFTYVNGTGIFTVASNALFYIGSPLYMTNTGGAIPSGFTLGTIYYAIPIFASTTTFQVATTYANAIAGTAFVPASDNGSGTNTINFALAGTEGEPYHTQLIAELVAHNHPGSNYTPYLKDATATGGGAFHVPSDNPGGALTLNIASQGGGSPFNIIQPSTYVNVFMKL